MAEMMRDLNVKFAWIPMAQSMIETGHWHSDIFIENNNLFGMKEAKSRITTAIGTNKNHAEYNTWRESVYDYAFYQSRYLGKIRSEADYYQYLNASYAEDPTYVAKIKQMVERHKLKQLFN
jgi:flagellum-specific peptidoglycan hydrolase FlgJ